MGIYDGTYLGIYLIVPHRKVEDKIIFYKDPKTGKKMKDRFNPKTGVEGIKNERIDIEYIAPLVYIEDVDELREDMFWEPAYSGSPKRTSTFILNDDSITIDECQNYDLSKINVEEELSKFKEKYSKYLDYFTKKYGEIKIHYGIVNYVN
jgi:hypothetical protein